MNLKWTKSKQERLFRGKFIGRNNGCCCLFIRITPSTGIKLYNTKDERDFAFQKQKEASLLDIGPMVGARFSLTRKKFDSIVRKSGISSYPMQGVGSVYGYVTEAVKTYKINEQYDENERHLLVSKMRENGFITVDLHQYNIGKRKKGMMCIDFDRGIM